MFSRLQYCIRLKYLSFKYQIIKFVGNKTSEDFRYLNKLSCKLKSIREQKKYFELKDLVHYSKLLL